MTAQQLFKTIASARNPNARRIAAPLRTLDADAPQRQIFLISETLNYPQLFRNIHSFMEDCGNNERRLIDADICRVMMPDALESKHRVLDPVVVFGFEPRSTSGIRSKPARKIRPHVFACSGDHFRAVSRIANQ